ncbi:MAG: divalent-cation tolerance protein CutA [Rickettsiales bacterium]|jgi:periplasmic divalent cation tolerance protein|nr:divalent-cation tolerance protein CutA [Rickettsiales bacterium]
MTFCLCLTTVHNKSEADKITDTILEKRMAACIQQIPITSRYWWEGCIGSSEEILLMIKTQSDLWNPLSELIKSVHAYNVPEIIKLSIEDGLPEYLKWIKTETY